MVDKARYVRKRFPRKNSEIDLLLAEDSEFGDICEDYNSCINSLRYWAKSKEPEAEIRVSEYRTLVRELEEEMAEALDALNSRRISYKVLAC